jgi:YD repeat-containing protein
MSGVMRARSIMRGNVSHLEFFLGLTITYFTDSAGRKPSRSDPMDEVTKYTYNAFNQPTQIVDANQGTTLFGYDAVGNRTSVTDPRNTSTVPRHWQHSPALRSGTSGRALERAIYGDLFPVVPSIANRNNSGALN